MCICQMGIPLSGYFYFQGDDIYDSRTGFNEYRSHF